MATLERDRARNRAARPDIRAVGFMRRDDPDPAVPLLPRIAKGLMPPGARPRRAKLFAPRRLRPCARPHRNGSADLRDEVEPDLEAGDLSLAEALGS